MLLVLTDLLKDTAQVAKDRVKTEMENAKSEDTKKILAYIAHLVGKVEEIAEIAKEKKSDEAAEKQMSEIVKALNELNKKADGIEKGLGIHDDNLEAVGKGLKKNQEIIYSKLKRIETQLSNIHSMAVEIGVIERQVNSLYQRGYSPL